MWWTMKPAWVLVLRVITEIIFSSNPSALSSQRWKSQSQSNRHKDDKVFYLGPLKTKNSKRDLYVPKKLYDFLLEYKEKQDEDSKVLGYRNTEIVYDRNGKNKNDPIQGGDFIQRKENGELITINSVKYWTDKVKKEKGVDFHFHALRHTAASMLAARNIPINTLVDFLGHANANTAQKYYITSTELAKQRLKKAQDEIY